MSQSVKYYQFINTLAKIGFDANEDPSYCEVYDLNNRQFTRRNDLLDDILNHPETKEIDTQNFNKILSDFDRRNETPCDLTH